MNEELIRKYANLMKELDLTAIEVKDDSTAIRLERTIAVSPQIYQAPLSEEKTDTAEFDSSGLDRITSPMVGVFYAAPAENAEPFVKVGDRVKKGDTLCIIEAMKLMNEVTAERDCVIREICVNNAQTVEYGTILFLIGD